MVYYDHNTLKYNYIMKCMFQYRNCQMILRRYCWCRHIMKLGFISKKHSFLKRPSSISNHWTGKIAIDSIQLLIDSTIPVNLILMPNITGWKFFFSSSSESLGKGMPIPDCEPLSTKVDSFSNNTNVNEDTDLTLESKGIIFVLS